MATATSERRSSWVQLLPRAAADPSPSSIAHDLAARELLRNVPEIYEVGCLAGIPKPKIDSWEDLFTPMEVAIIGEGSRLKNFNEFLAFMIQLFSEERKAAVVKKAISLWHQIEQNKGN